MSTQDWIIAFDRLKQWGLMRVDLSGGEPTMRHDLPEIAWSAVNAGINVVISTNGLVIKEKSLEEYPKVRWHVSLDSGIEVIHERSRLLPVLKPSTGSFRRATDFLRSCIHQGCDVRVLTCLGPHNRDQLFALGEHLALTGVKEWNLSRVLRAGRAQSDYENLWAVAEEGILEQLAYLRKAFPFIRIRYSTRSEQNGYFLLVLPDGSLATQRTDGNDKVALGDLFNMTLEDLQFSSEFDLAEHGRKWISSTLEWQPFCLQCSPELWDPLPADSCLAV